MWLTMETVTVSKKYQIVFPEKLRKRAGIKPGDKMVDITKHGIIQYIAVRPLKETEGFISELDIENLRDKTDKN
jgi:AbrB family looped-hinge helix DNA binding protein